MNSTTALVTEVAELRQVVRDLVDAARDVLAEGDSVRLVTLVRLRRAAERGDRAVGRAPR